MSIQVAKLEKLTKDNYASWKYKVMLYLKAEELWQLVVDEKVDDKDVKNEGKMGKSEITDGIDPKSLNKKNAQAMVVISNTLSSSLIPHVKNCSTAKEMWDALAKLFSNVSSARKMQLKEQLHNIKMERNMLIMDYISNIRKIVDALALID